jgi:hypothetical protein
VVSDRRRFAPEGELREDAPVAEEEKPVPQTPAAAPAPPVEPAVSAAATPEGQPGEAAGEHEMPPPPTAAEQQEQSDAYKATGKKLDEIFSKAGARRESLPEMTFGRLIESFYMTALLQLGAIRQEGEPAGVDIIGARQTIDSIAILQEKTRGNLIDQEQTLLQNVLFELRMAWIEVTNALANAAAKPGAGQVSTKK